MKLLTVSLEKRAIRTILAGSRNALANRLLGTLSDDHFHYPPAVEAYRRIKSQLKNDGKLPTWIELINDPAIEQRNRQLWQEYTKKPLRKSEDGQVLIKRLEQYRLLRLIYYRSRTNIKVLQEDQVDIEKLVGDNLTTFNQDYGFIDPDQVFRHFGTLSNESGLIERLKKNELVTMIPTGITAFDRTNVGVALGSLFVIGATTGGGKTSVAMNIGINMAKFGAKVCHVNMEMSKDELECRLFANLAGIKHDKFLKPDERMGPEDYRKIEKAERRFNRQLKKLSAQFTFMVPNVDPNIEELFMFLKPYHYDVVIVDMLNLLKGVGGDNQWRKLGDAARFAKRWASANDCIVILLCQLSAEGLLRYAREIAEHASLFWSWISTEETRKNQVQRIKIVKARNAQTFDFKLRTDFARMRFVSEAIKDDEEEVEKKGKRGKKRKGRSEQPADEDYYDT